MLKVGKSLIKLNDVLFSYNFIHSIKIIFMLRIIFFHSAHIENILTGKWQMVNEKCRDL